MGKACCGIPGGEAINHKLRRSSNSKPAPVSCTVCLPVLTADRLMKANGSVTPAPPSAYATFTLMCGWSYHQLRRYKNALMRPITAPLTATHSMIPKLASPSTLNFIPDYHLSSYSTGHPGISSSISDISRIVAFSATITFW